MLESDVNDLIAALDWQIMMGADEAIADAPLDRLALVAAQKQARLARQEAYLAENRRQNADPGAGSKPTHSPAPSPTRSRPAAADEDAPLGTAEALAAATEMLGRCHTLDDLQAILKDFTGLSIARTADNLVFGDGNPEADIMVIGEAPGRDEDIQGKPFVGVSGQFLDRMLEPIGLTRGNFYITNTVYWRPPGNRKPNDGEFAVCQPFVEKHIELIDPKVILLVGDKAVRGLAGVTMGITKSRGKWYDVKAGGKTVPALATFHPAYLLRNPSSKRYTWRDLLAFQRKLQEMGLG